MKVLSFFAVSGALVQLVSGLMISVPSKMAISQSLRNSLPGLYSAPLFPLDLGAGHVQEAEQTRTLQDVAIQQADDNAKIGSLAFVVRRPG